MRRAACEKGNKPGTKSWRAVVGGLRIWTDIAFLAIEIEQSWALGAVTFQQGVRWIKGKSYLAQKPSSEVTVAVQVRTMWTWCGGAVSSFLPPK